MDKERAKNVVKKIRTMVMLLLTGMVLTFSSPALTALAEGLGQTPVEDIFNSGKSLEDSSLKEFGNKVNDLGGGGYHLIYKIAVWLGIIMGMIAGIWLMLSNAGNRNEAKSKILCVIGGLLIVFSILGAVAYLQNIGSGLFQ